MTISSSLLATLVTVALIVVTLSPLLLIGLLAKDWKSGNLW
ncbi:MAG: hypothetical protein PVI91_00910 [Gammaproteobacteria bacterium]|jgi:hypothetical protein